jgi:hypothetical protein
MKYVVFLLIIGSLFSCKKGSYSCKNSAGTVLITGCTNCTTSEKNQFDKDCATFNGIVTKD